MLDLNPLGGASTLALHTPFALPDLDLSPAPAPSSEALRSQALQAATELLQREGVAALGPENLARASGLPLLVLRGLFAGRDEVLHALLRPLLQEQQTLLRGWSLVAARARDAELPRHVHTLLLCQWDVLRQHPGGPALLLALAQQPGLQDLRERSRLAATQLLEQACKRGHAAPQAQLAARLSLGALEMALLMLAGDAQQDAHQLAPAVARMVAGLWANPGRGRSAHKRR